MTTADASRPGWTRVYAWAHPVEVTYTPAQGEPGWPNSETVTVTAEGVEIPDSFAGPLLQSGTVMDHAQPKRLSR